MFDFPASVLDTTEVNFNLTPRGTRVMARLPAAPVSPMVIPSRIRRGPIADPPAEQQPVEEPPVQGTATEDVGIAAELTAVYPWPANVAHPQGAIPNLPTGKRKFYVIFRGLRIGVFFAEWSVLQIFRVGSVRSHSDT